MLVGVLPSYQMQSALQAHCQGALVWWNPFLEDILGSVPTGRARLFGCGMFLGFYYAIPNAVVWEPQNLSRSKSGLCPFVQEPGGTLHVLDIPLRGQHLGLQLQHFSLPGAGKFQPCQRTQNAGATTSPPQSMSDLPGAADASSLSAEDEKVCTISLFEDLVQKEYQSADITAKLQHTISVLFNAVSMQLELELPALAIPNDTSLGPRHSGTEQACSVSGSSQRSSNQCSGTKSNSIIT